MAAAIADELGAADLAQDLDRVGDAGDPSHRLLHGGALAGQALVVHAGAAPDPRRGLAAGERGGDRRRGVVLPIPISPSTRRSQSSASTASMAVRTTARNAPRRAPASKRMSPVGRPTPTSIGGHLGADDPGEGVDRRAALAVRRQHRLGHPGRIGAHLGRRRDAVVGGEDQPGGPVDRRRGRCAATRRPTRRSRRARPVRRSVGGCWPPARGRQRAPTRRASGRSSSNSWRRLIEGLRGGGDDRSGTVPGRSCSRRRDGSSRRRARPATINSASSAAAAHDLVHPAEHVAVAAAEREVGVDAHARPRW